VCHRVTRDAMSDASFKGIFGDRRGGRRAARRRPDTLTELRWHQELPADADAARAVSAAICAKVCVARAHRAGSGARAATCAPQAQ
jgi:hypothetical protein